jgi:hypothetical protein
MMMLLLGGSGGGDSELMRMLDRQSQRRDEGVCHYRASGQGGGGAVAGKLLASFCGTVMTNEMPSALRPTLVWSCERAFLGSRSVSCMHGFGAGGRTAMSCLVASPRK